MKGIGTNTIVVGLNILERNNLQFTAFPSKLLTGFFICQVLRNILGYEEQTTLKNAYYRRVNNDDLQFIADIKNANNTWSNHTTLFEFNKCFKDFDFFIKNIEEINDRVINRELRPENAEKEERIEQLIRDSNIDSTSIDIKEATTINRLKDVRDNLLKLIYN